MRPSALPDSALRPTRVRPQHLLTLASVEDDGLGEELQVVWEVEPGAEAVDRTALPEPGGVDPPGTLDAFLDAVRWGAVSTADVRSVQAPFRAGIAVEDYQLDPVVRAIQMPRANLLVADDVGLGKTIEAGMVGLELILRHRARRILVVCPSALQVQWRDQMRDKFGLDFRIVDSALMRDLRRSRGLTANPWSHFPRLVTSIDFLKRERPLRLFRDLLPGPDEPAYPRRFDLLILDEAHNCAPAGRGKYATDSLRTQALRVLAPHFEHKLFLTATPHNGYPESFTALLELLDNQRFARGTPPDRRQLEAVMVRRLKSELVKWDGSPRFPQRVPEPLEVPYTADERAVHAALRRYGHLRLERCSDPAERFATEFVLKTLKKRLFSSPASFALTLERHERSLHAARRPGARDRPSAGVLRREIDRVEEEYALDDEYDEATADAVDAASRLFREPAADEQALLDRMEAWARAAAARLDSKAETLVRWLHDHLRPGGTWGAERVIVFTEYRATQNWLKTVLATEGLTAGSRLLTMYGGMDRDDREAVKAAFQAAPAVSPVRILLATDAASEGLDLQNHCSKLVHYEVPWNPNRMEQRNGRIDRHGQRAGRVSVYHFVARGYRDRERQDFAGPVGDLDADLEFLMRAVRKVEAIREDLGKVGPVIAEQVEEAMLGRRTALNTAQAERDAEPVRRMLRFERNLARQIKALMDQHQETQRELRLSPENVRRVVEVALGLAGQPPLLPAALPDGRAGYHLPALSGSWAACGDGLTHPHTQEVRPVVFDHASAAGRDDVVLVHLNHRLAQMCLRLLRAEVWSPTGRRGLRRVTARLVPAHRLAAPAVVGHARLVVIGGDRHRLHEEVITAGGTIKEGRFTRMKTVGEVDAALDAATGAEPGDGVKGTLLGLYPKLAPALAQALEARAEDRAGGLEKKLAERADKEAADLRAVMTELQRAIEKELDDPEYAPPTLFDSLEESAQFEKNRLSLQGRLAELPAEIEREVAALRGRYGSLQARMFPVAVTFLVPDTMAK